MLTTPSIQLIRHATLLVQLNGQRILVDPMLGVKGSMPPIPFTANRIRIPMVDLPMNEAALNQLLHTIDAVIVTHTHQDHWDDAAIRFIPKDKQLFCQSVDEQLIRKQGFTQVKAIETSGAWQGITITRTSGRHGTCVIGKIAGHVSGFVMETKDAPKIYIAGDTIWCDEVENALKLHKPQLTVLNTGAAKLLIGRPITMTGEDIQRVCQTDRGMKVIAVHMDTVNHCFLTRNLLHEFVNANGLQKQVLIPDDGQTLSL